MAGQNERDAQTDSQEEVPDAKLTKLVADKAIEQLEKVAGTNERTAQMSQEEDEVSDAELAQR